MALGDRSTAQDGFFDVLIDRLIIDVKRDFEAARRAEDEVAHHDSIFDEPVVKHPPQIDDIVSKMIGFRVRMASNPAPQSPRSYLPTATPPTTPRYTTEQLQIGLAPAPRSKAKPHFSSNAAQVAFTVVVKAGAQFFEEDVVCDAITDEALKRERRRVLLTLHPDRVPETDRAKAHERFLSAAEAFATLAETRETRAA